MTRPLTDTESRPTEAVDLSANLINTTSDPTDFDSAVKQNKSSTVTDDKDSVDCPTKQDSSATSSEPSHKPVESDTSNKQSKELDSSTPSTDCQSKQEDSDTSKCMSVNNQDYNNYHKPHL